MRRQSIGIPDTAGEHAVAVALRCMARETAASPVAEAPPIYDRLTGESFFWFPQIGWPCSEHAVTVACIVLSATKNSPLCPTR